MLHKIGKIGFQKEVVVIPKMFLLHGEGLMLLKVIGREKQVDIEIFLL